jgi:hypothetical protein
LVYKEVTVQEARQEFLLSKIIDQDSDSDNDNDESTNFFASSLRKKNGEPEINGFDEFDI